MRTRYKWLAALGIVVMTGLPPTIVAAERASDTLSVAIPEIIVTADYRRRAIDDVPVSLSVIDQDTIERRNAQHLEDLLGMVPNLNYSGGTSRARFFQIRGVGDLEQFDAPLNSSVGVIVDNVDFSGAATMATLFDVPPGTGDPCCAPRPPTMTATLWAAWCLDPSMSGSCIALPRSPTKAMASSTTLSSIVKTPTIETS